MEYKRVATITGHRPNRIPSMQYVNAQLHNAFIDLDVDYVIQGMAAGVDLESAYVAYDLKIPFACAIPWAGHGPQKGDAKCYEWAFFNADQVWVVNDCEGYPGPQVYQERNEFMVDRAHVVIAVWDGLKKGGTWNCIRYALEEGRRIWMIDPDPNNMRAGWYDD